MIVRVPEIEIGFPSRSTILSLLKKSVIAAGMVAGLVMLADWRLNSRMDRNALERLAADTTGGQPSPDTPISKPRKR